MSINIQVKGDGPFEVIETDSLVEGFRPMTREEYAALVAACIPPTLTPAGPLKIDSDTVLSRLTTAEREALFTARRTIWQVDYFLTRAASTGIVSTADPDLASAQQLFAAYGIIASERWADILAP